MKPSTKGYSPEQVASGTLDNGKSVTILYIKEFADQLNRVSKAELLQYYYNWSYMEESNSYVLFIYWTNDAEIAIVFPPQQHSVIDSLREPRDLIVTATPINILIEKARQTGEDFFDLEGAAVIRDVVFKEPGGIEN